MAGPEIAHRTRTEICVLHEALIRIQLWASARAHKSDPQICLRSDVFELVRVVPTSRNYCKTQHFRHFAGASGAATQNRLDNPLTTPNAQLTTPLDNPILTTPAARLFLYDIVNVFITFNINSLKHSVF